MSDTRVGSLSNVASSAISSWWERDNASKGAVAVGVVVITAAVYFCVRHKTNNFSPVDQNIREGAHTVRLIANETRFNIELTGPLTTLTPRLKQRIATVLQNWCRFRSITVTPHLPPVHLLSAPRFSTPDDSGPPPALDENVITPEKSMTVSNDNHEVMRLSRTYNRTDNRYHFEVTVSPLPALPENPPSSPELVKSVASLMNEVTIGYHMDNAIVEFRRELGLTQEFFIPTRS